MLYALSTYTTVVFGFLTALASAQYLNAECHVEANSGSDRSQPVNGFIFLSQPELKGPTKVLIKLNGFRKNVRVTRHGFHVHENGDTSDKCEAAGAHFNPENVTHGAPWDKVRHAGDLGNVEVRFGRARAIVRDLTIRLNNTDYNSIIGRSIVVHAWVDDLGRGNKNDSLKTGHAGPRLGCCVIKRVAYHSSPLASICFGRRARRHRELCHWQQVSDDEDITTGKKESDHTPSSRDTGETSHKQRKTTYHGRSTEIN